MSTEVQRQLTNLWHKYQEAQSRNARLIQMLNNIERTEISFIRFKEEKVQIGPRVNVRRKSRAKVSIVNTTDIASVVEREIRTRRPQSPENGEPSGKRLRSSHHRHQLR